MIWKVLPVGSGDVLRRVYTDTPGGYRIEASLFGRGTESHPHRVRVRCLANLPVAPDPRLPTLEEIIAACDEILPLGTIWTMTFLSVAPGQRVWANPDTQAVGSSVAHGHVLELQQIGRGPVPPGLARLNQPPELVAS
jgi:hypothetical protein